jgi:hypothetical protein
MKFAKRSFTLKFWRMQAKITCSGACLLDKQTRTFDDSKIISKIVVCTLQEVDNYSKWHLFLAPFARLLEL